MAAVAVSKNLGVVNPPFCMDVACLIIFIRNFFKYSGNVGGRNARIKRSHLFGKDRCPFSYPWTGFR